MSSPTGGILGYQDRRLLPTGRVVFEGAPADLIAARSTLTGKHLAAYVGP